MLILSKCLGDVNGDGCGDLGEGSLSVAAEGDVAHWVFFLPPIGGDADVFEFGDAGPLLTVVTATANESFTPGVKVGFLAHFMVWDLHRQRIGFAEGD